ncbi:probable D-lactate dehydrogenase, mitochondrial isoform X1 [Rhipicephalus sanguineus]|uniref:probable D-lactate dehydrogenase, mitochondrial isoform X1 n=1 Tax=Rhipicephalus sanguineus TaxID=34632 RepID=UPI001894D0CF|nr:probable D-lactate dehydrogenase, mitochondrial isoform X1 [Rhipicephalus sanguineus]XP_037508239.1 probable D-lactate dehydrogenase, mitochondrial isoform X1 [Rhipicephalus sanguineus]
MLVSRVPWCSLCRGALRRATGAGSGPAVSGRRWFSQDVIKELEAIFGPKNVSTTEAIKEQHSRDEGPHSPSPPDVVVFAQDTSQVSRTAKLCYQKGIPMMPFGSGSGLEGGVNAVKGGVCIDVSQMDKMVELNASDFDVVVEPGLTWRNLNQQIRDTGLWFPVDPGADASLGGMCATSASGTNAVRYGTMRENVLNLEVVLPDGTVVNTAGKGRRTRKTSAGYNLTNLFVGSEGTLGIITQATLRLHSAPQVIVAAVCPFPTTTAAVEAVVQTLQCNVPVARIEFLDENTITACNKYSKTNYKVTPTLFLEFHGSSDQAVREQVDIVTEIAHSNGASELQWAREPEERSKLWKARHAIFYATCALRPNTRCYVTDVCVPISRLPALVAVAKEDIEQHGILATVVGHVGDGNFHTMMLFDPQDPKDTANIFDVAHKLASRALDLNGTSTGEHGIGIGKRGLLVRELGESGIQLMRTLKNAVDPKGIMNPGKLFL